MLNIIKDKVQKRLIFIQEKCFELTILEYQYLLIQMSQRITTSGEVKILEERLMNESSLNSITSDSIRDKYFLELAKLLEDESRNEPNSFPNLKAIIEKNLNSFPKNLSEQISTSLLAAKACFKQYHEQILELKLHRDKCLGHNDKKAECKHLDHITSLETRALIEALIQFTNDLSMIFEYEKFDTKKNEEMKDNMSHATYERIKKLERL